MYFNKLPTNIQSAIFNLTKDKTFQHRFATDKELDELDNLKNNPSEEFKALQAVLRSAIGFWWPQNQTHYSGNMGLALGNIFPLCGDG